MQQIDYGEQRTYYIDQGDLGLISNILLNVCIQECTNENEDTSFSPHSILLKGTLPKLDGAWDCFFFTYPCSLRSSVIAKVGQSAEIDALRFSEMLSDAYEQFYAEMHRRLLNNNSRIVPMMCISFGDICVLCPHGLYGYDQIKSTVEETFRAMGNIYKDNARDMPIENIEMVQNEIWNRFNKMYIFAQNPHYDAYQKLFQDLMNLDVGGNDRTMYMLLLCSLMLRVILDETAVRWIYDSGDIKDDNYIIANDQSNAYKRTMTAFKMFIEQVSASAPYSDQIWSLFALTQVMLSSIVGRDTQTAKKREIDMAVHNNFFGFVPYISSSHTEVSSFYPSHLSPDYCFGFLAIPQTEQFKLWSFFPAFVHEFFHYIPPANRKQRNEKILFLSIYSAAIPLYSAIKSENKEIYEYIVKKMAWQIDRYRCKLAMSRNGMTSNDRDEFESEVEHNRDTMKYLAIMRWLLPTIDFDSIYGQAVKAAINKFSPDSKLKEILIDQSIQAECRNLWNTDIVNYIHSYTFAMREIRSDMFMCEMLNIDLYQYIELMAKEPAFAENDENFVADSTKLRFGFMTKYLYIKGEKCPTEERGSYLDWNFICNQIIECSDNWIDSCKDKIDDIAKNHNEYRIRLDHLHKYLISYATITSSQKDGNKTVFDEVLCSSTFVLYDRPNVEDNRDCNLVYSWGRDMNRYRKYEIINQLSNLYAKYQECQKKRAVEKYYFEWRTRQLLRDLLMVFPNVDLIQ